MADPRGFLKAGRTLPARRPVDVRIRDWREVYEDFPETDIVRQASRCMDCGVPFCHDGCPLGNLIPEWNDLVWRQDWVAAMERLHATNNFPDFTGRLCPAPCETACVLGINQDPVTIKQIEFEIVDRAWNEGWIRPHPPAHLTGKTVAVVGSGPAGLATAQQLVRAGHTVAVYERSDRVGGLLRYGIPEFKMEKRHIDRRIGQLRAEGVKFRTEIEVGIDITADDLRRRYDAVVLAIGSTVPRGLSVPGSDLNGVHQAMEYLPLANRVCEGDLEVSPINAHGKNVVIIGGGDTGADCLGTAVRQEAASIIQLEIMPRPPEARPSGQPWPIYPNVFRISSAHEEAGERRFGVSTLAFHDRGNGQVAGLELVEVSWDNGSFSSIEGSEHRLPVDLVFMAMGFTGPEAGLIGEQLGLGIDQRGNIVRDEGYQTEVEGVFVAGDAGRGQSLIVWAIAEGRGAAAAVDRYLTGTTNLSTPISSSARQRVV
ncbi:MAG: glutamate synthase subunit beta [Candidatus Nanopelagicales bacterium]|nr:glutamate synthase subunit beta [Candidatus Nanopelagicales bacterium]